MITLKLLAINIYFSDYRPYKYDFIQAHHTKIQINENEGNLLLNNATCLYSEGSSMNPVMFNDNYVCYKKAVIDDVKLGNIIVFRKEDQILAHRVVVKEGNRILTKGDNNNIREEVIPEDIIGIVVAIIYT